MADDAREEAPGKGKDAGCGCRGQHEAVYPKVTFSTFILSLASAGLAHLGEAPDPVTGASAVNLAAAKHTVDTLAMLKEKTSACLDAEEKRLLEGLLYELRMKYVVKAK